MSCRLLLHCLDCALSLIALGWKITVEVKGLTVQAGGHQGHHQRGRPYLGNNLYSVSVAEFNESCTGVGNSWKTCFRYESHVIAVIEKPEI